MCCCTRTTETYTVGQPFQLAEFQTEEMNCLWESDAKHDSLDTSPEIDSNS
jgi:hypothetical protein